MPTTTNRGYVTPAHGGGVNVWDGDINGVFSQVDQNLGAVSNVALSSSNVTLSSGQYVCGTIRFSGTLTANVVITFPAVSGWWVVENLCTPAFYIQLTCGAGNRICAPPGEAVDILTDGTNVKYRNLGRVGSEIPFDLAGVPGWISNCTVPPYLLGNGSSFSAVTYPALAIFLGGTTLPDTRGRARFNLNSGTGRLTSAGGIDGDTFYAGGGTGTGLAVAQVNLPAGVTLATTIAAGQGTHFHQPAGGGVFLKSGAGASAQSGSPGADAATTDAATLPAMSGTTPLGGSGTPLASVPPGYVGGVTMIRAA